MKQLIPGSCEYKHLLDSRKFIDMMLHTVEGAEIPAHKIIMASLSPDFCTLMKQPERTQSLPFSTEAVNSLVQLAYTGRITITESTLEEQLEVAALYTINLLTKLCGEFMITSLTTENSYIYFKFCQKFCCHHFTDTVEKFICRNFLKIKNLASILTVEELRKCLMREDLHSTTDNLLSFIKLWAGNNLMAESKREELVALARRVIRKPAQVIVSFGGWSNQPSSKVEVFNSLSNTWTPSYFQPPLAVAYHGLEVVQDNLYIVGDYSVGSELYRGGSSSDLPAAHAFPPQTTSSTWTPAGKSAPCCPACPADGATWPRRSSTIGGAPLPVLLSLQAACQ